MKWLNSTRSATKLAAGALVCALPFLASNSQAMPSFARQTGMVCNSCHIGTDSVPNFTRTGRLFAMRGYTRPIVREKLRGDGQTVDGEPQYGGDYISLNWTDFFAARLVSDIASQSESTNTAGVKTKSDVTSKPLSRMALFYTGPVTDWMGLWTEIAYLGNNNLSSVNKIDGVSGTPTGLNLFAYDEYRLSTSRTIGENSFIGMSIGNEPGDVVSQFVFPTGIPRFFSLGQGGSGKSLDMMTISFHALIDDRWWVQFAPNTGVTNNSWSNGSQQYYALAYDFGRKTDNDLWLGIEYETGNDTAPIMTPTKVSFICTGTCPAGVSDAGGLSFANTLGGYSISGAPVESIDTFNTYSLRAEYVVADRGVHSWVAMLQANGTKQNYKSGASAQRNDAGAYIRYFYKRTYGIQASYYRDLNYKYTDTTGLVHDFGHKSGTNIALLWNPAMNFSMHLSINPESTSRTYAGLESKSSSWSLGMEYSF
jgi:hypothetical protein